MRKEAFWSREFETDLVVPGAIEDTCLGRSHHMPERVARSFDINGLATIRNPIDHVPDELSVHNTSRLGNIDLDHPQRFEREFQIPNCPTQDDFLGDFLQGIALRCVIWCPV